jgi:hypothetical protein
MNSKQKYISKILEDSVKKSKTISGRKTLILEKKPTEKEKLENYQKKYFKKAYA